MEVVGRLTSAAATVRGGMKVRESEWRASDDLGRKTSDLNFGILADLNTQV